MKKFIPIIILIFSIIIFSGFIYTASPYRMLRPYSLFGVNLAERSQIRNLNDRTIVRITTDKDDFYIDQNLITVGNYKECVSTKSCNQAHYRDNYTNFLNNKLLEIYPVTFITWDEARTYCQSQGGDLPTAVQWEAAAGMDSQYAWGNELPNLSTANLDGYYQWLTPAGWLPKGASKYGVLDLNGNLREWILDENPDESSSKALKGASFQDSFEDGKNDQIIYHWQYSPGFNRGFRCVYPAN